MQIKLGLVKGVERGSYSVGASPEPYKPNKNTSREPPTASTANQGFPKAFAALETAKKKKKGTERRGLTQSDWPSSWTCRRAGGSCS